MATSSKSSKSWKIVSFLSILIGTVGIDAQMSLGASQSVSQASLQATQPAVSITTTTSTKSRAKSSSRVVVATDQAQIAQVPDAKANATTWRKGSMRIVNVGYNGLDQFYPANLQIVVGDTVVWTWESGLHTITQVQAQGVCMPIKQPMFKSDMLGPPGTGASEAFEFTFTKAGKYFYASTLPGKCEKGMFGVVEVLPQGIAPVPPEYAAVLPTPAQALPDGPKRKH